MAYKGPRLSELKGNALKKRIKQLAASGNTSAIPTKYLTGDLAGIARERALNARLDTPVVEGSSLTGRGLAREANQATQIQYGGSDTALRQSADEVARRETRNAGYYDAYLNTLRQSAAEQQQRAQATAGAIANVGATGQAAAGTQANSTLAQMQAEAAKRGGTVDPQLAVQMAQGAQVNRNLSDSQAGTAALTGQAQQGYQQALIAAAQAGKIQGMAAVAGDAAKVRDQQADLAREKGAYNQNYRSKRTSEEFTNVATAALTGMKQDTADAQFSKDTGYSPAQWAQMTPGERREALRSVSRATAAPKAPKSDEPYKFGYTKKEWLKLSLSERQRITKENEKKPGSKNGKDGKPVSGVGSLNPAAEAKFVSQINRAAQSLNDLTIATKDQSGNVTTRKAKNRGEVIAHLKGLGIDPRVLGVANSLSANKMKGIGSVGVQHAHKLGIHVGGNFKIIGRKKKPKPKLPDADGIF